MNKVLSTYAAYSLDVQERFASSSGGVFSLLSKGILNDGSSVYGVALSADCRKAEFIRVQDEDGLVKLRGSKYFQASVGVVFKDVERDLKNGLKVLFSGTPCQINGLIGYLGAGCDAVQIKAKCENLYCVDVICHGTPSPALWQKYVDYIEKERNARLVGINFRCKEKGWTDFGIKEIDENHQAMFISKDTDTFMQMFLRNY